MSAVELDRQGIERRDFPIARRGYDPATVDAHLRALSAEVEELQRETEHSGRESLATVAGTQVQGILEAAQATAETIQREAAQDAQRVRGAADADARRTREEAIARAQAHVAAVSQATEALLARVGSMDGETRALVESLRSGAGRLAGDLGAVEAEMEALYDAAGGRGGYTGDGESLEAKDQLGQNGATPAPAGAVSPAGAPVERLSEPQAESYGVNPAEQYAPQQGASHVELLTESREYEPTLGEESLFAHQEDRGESQQAQGDMDGARLVALNMALNGDSREDTGRYLAENFEIAEPERLLDEVYAAIEG
ncbi:MAG TPA: hypothetical protein VIJ33_03460 [Solirubrobacteraceae bacterium]